jgi:hypothetical protein
MDLVGHPRLQAQDPVSPKYKGIADCVRRSVAEEGFMVRALADRCRDVGLEGM